MECGEARTPSERAAVPGRGGRERPLRKFLIILDDTPEMLNAMRYAAIRASKTGGGVEMLAVISPEEFQHFMGVADVMRAEAREKIEAHFQIFKDRMEKREGLTPTLVVREGDKVDSVIEHIKSDPEIGVLVIGAGVDKSGPGPLVAALTGRRLGELRVPITIVPGTMTKEEIIAAS
jgi:nucleotide-binding universal stress UspA family protein